MFWCRGVAFRYFVRLFQRSLYVSIKVNQRVMMVRIGCSMRVARAMSVAGIATSMVIRKPRMPKNVIMFL